MTPKSRDQINRRVFLKNSTALVASAALFSYGGFEVFGAERLSSSKTSIPSVILNNGVKMPMLGFGTNTLRGEVGTRSVADALSVGYRLIDTATIYGNEEAVGKGIAQSGLDRSELFVTSKLWVDDSGYDSAKKAFETSLSKLGTDYLDLYLIHRPRGDIKGSWKAMQELCEAGKIRAIGVSNFDAGQIRDLMKEARIKPSVNQIETHVFFQQYEAHEFLKASNIQIEAWSPFAAGRNGVFTNPVLAEIGQKYDKTNAQVCLRWLNQRGIVAIPRSSNKEHMMENLDIFDFELDVADMKAIATLDLNRTQFPEWG
jgi:2,5-diketo-D-gluconate reductase A